MPIYYPGVPGPVTRPISAPGQPLMGSLSFPLPRPVIQHLPQRRARAGSNLLCGDGVAVPAAVSLGVPVTKSFRYSAGSAW